MTPMRYAQGTTALRKYDHRPAAEQNLQEACSLNHAAANQLHGIRSSGGIALTPGHVGRRQGPLVLRSAPPTCTSEGSRTGPSVRRMTCRRS